MSADLAEVRARTLRLLDQVPDHYLKRRVHSFYSPIGWHFGHVGRTEEFWVVKEGLGRPCLDDHLSFLFADLPESPKDNRVNLPSREDIVGYLEQTRARVLAALDEVDLGSDNPYLAGGYAWEFAIQHECQHQETIAEMLQLIWKDAADGAQMEAFPWVSGASESWVAIPAGEFEMGSDDPFGYDNEKRAHKVRVEAFRLAKHPVTAYEWSQFMADGGYRRPELWSEPGWAWREAERAVAPEFWLSHAEGHFAYGMHGLRPIHPDEPAMSVSWYEAEAYACWRGKRLPTEAEWEYTAALHGDAAAACCGLSLGHASPVSGWDLFGNCWEWTSSKFLPYPGFKAFPYDGYSKDHMKGEHFVCRGGSWATSPRLLRRSFRNWYVPTYRQGFLGVRLAEF